MKQIILGSLALGYLLAQEDDISSKQLMKREEIKVLEEVRETKTGIIAGIEVGLGGGIGKSKMVEQKLPNLPKSLLSSLNVFETTAKFFVGYQKYFGASEPLGFDIKGKVGTGYLSIKHEGQTIMRDSKYETAGDSGIGLATAYVPYSFGVETNFLYDFWRKDDQTLGMSVGVGYDFVYGVNTTMVFNDGFLPGIFGSYVNTYRDKNIAYSVISPKLGVHYYIGRHQLAGVFSLDKALGVSQNVNFTFDKGNAVKDTLMTELNLLFTFNLTYAYRF